MNDSFFEYNKRKIDNKNKKKNKIIKKIFIFMERINKLINNNKKNSLNIIFTLLTNCIDLEMSFVKFFIFSSVFKFKKFI